eukprot:1159441-Pelagomonas_calceolata.AAC.3
MAISPHSYPRFLREIAQRLVARWQTLGLQADPSKKREALDVSPWLQRCFLDIIGAAGFAKDFNALEGGHSSIFQVVHDAVLVYDRRSVQPLEAPLCRIVIEIVHAYLPISLLLQNAKTAINFFPTVACRLLPMLPLAREANRAMAKFRET